MPTLPFHFIGARYVLSHHKKVNFQAVFSISVIIRYYPLSSVAYLSLLLAVFLWMQVVACNAEIAAISTISQAELISQIQAKQPPLILDVRTTSEYDAGHIPGAININFKELKKRINEIDDWKKSTVVVYCERGVRAKIAETTLHQAGFQSILHLEGDMSAWRKNSLPVDSNQ